MSPLHTSNETGVVRVPVPAFFAEWPPGLRPARVHVGAHGVLLVYVHPRGASARAWVLATQGGVEVRDGGSEGFSPEAVQRLHRALRWRWRRDGAAREWLRTGPEVSSSLHDDEAGLAPDPADIEHFVEHGYLFVPGCFAPETAARLVHESLDLRDPPPQLGRRESELRPVDPELDLRDPSTWGGRERLEVSTGRSLDIEQLSRKLWATLQALVGEGRIRRRTMGEMWIINGPGVFYPGPIHSEDYNALFAWHIDSPATRTTLDGRRDALVLLVPWSDLGPGDGGTLFSGRSLDAVVRSLESHPEGVDTTSPQWGVECVRGCDDVRELVGRAGDVLILHAFALHAGHNHQGTVMRIIDNPTITVAEPLSYHTDNPDPSPVERAVIRRLSRPRPRGEHRDPDEALIDGPVRRRT